MTWAHLDKQMAAWSDRLVSEIKIADQDSRKLATIIAGDVRFLAVEAKSEIAAASPIPLNDRLKELQAFQGWMDIVSGSAPVSPFIVRAQVVTQNYICFVYLPESCFRVLSKVSPTGSVAKKCAQFLCNSNVRAFRNAIAHANWSYRSDFRAIEYWAKIGSDPGEALVKFQVVQEELEFWQSLSRCVAYAAFSNL